MSSAFGMGFWIDEEGVFMSCPAFESVSYTHLTLPTKDSV